MGLGTSEESAASSTSKPSGTVSVWAPNLKSPACAEARNNENKPAGKKRAWRMEKKEEGTNLSGEARILQAPEAFKNAYRITLSTKIMLIQR